MPDTPLLQISYLLVTNVKVGNRVRPGLLISADDMRLLRRLSDRDIVIKLVCPGLRSYHARLQALLRRAVQVPGRFDWFVPASLTGPLKSPGPPATTE